MTATIWKRLRIALALTLVLSAGASLKAQAPTERWTEKRANDWYATQPWPVGANFLPSTAINELEMWQGATFDETTIDRELGWAEGIGMNTMRVFLHNLLWEQDPKGSTERIDKFLVIADRHHIRPIFVLFDSCWEPFPKLGPQHPPIPGVHNSGWVQAPGAEVLADPTQTPRLENYVKGVVGAFANDQRILAWDLWNEPDNGNESSYARGEPRNKNEIIFGLLPQVFAWARTAHPVQPLTSGLWHGEWVSLETMPPLARVQIAESDVISFHNYGWPEDFEGGQEPNQPAMGLLAEALRNNSANHLVPRRLLPGRQALSSTRSRHHPLTYSSKVSPNARRRIKRWLYFPMQKVEKIRLRMSSGVVCPVSESSAHKPR